MLRLRGVSPTDRTDAVLRLLAEQPGVATTATAPPRGVV
jgi:hypothetical protein